MKQLSRLLPLAILAAAVGGAACAAYGFSFLRSFSNDSLVHAAWVRARADSRVIDALGAPVERSWFVTGHRTQSDNYESARYAFTISGPRGSGKVFLEGELGGNLARLTYKKLIVKASDAELDLLRPSAPPVATRNEDCELSMDCERRGRCRERDGGCVTGSPQDCWQSDICRVEGRCYALDGECRPATKEHCLRSTNCQSEGRCVLSGGQCIQPPPDCNDSGACMEEGQCTLEGDRCVATNDGCLRSRACRGGEHRCRAENGACVHSTAQNSRSAMRAGAAVVNGRIPRETVEHVLDLGSDAFRGCHEEGLSRTPTLRGRIVLRFVIGRDGSISNVALGGSDLPDSMVVSCVVRAVYDLKFPAPGGGIATVRYPLLFSPAP